MRRSRRWDEGSEILRSRRLYIVAQGCGFLLHFVQAVLNHIADRYDADDLILLYDRNMPELAVGHALHDGAHSLVLTTGDNLAGHHLSKRLAKHLRALLSQNPHDVAFGEDPNDSAIRSENEQCANFVLRQRSLAV